MRPATGRLLAVLLAGALAVSSILAAGPATATTPPVTPSTAADDDDRSDDEQLVVTLADDAVVAAEHVTDVMASVDGDVRVRPHSELMTVTVPNDAVAATRAELAASPLVDTVEVDPRVETARTPNDPRYGAQWALPHVDAPGAWSHTVGSSSVSIAVLDTGVDGSHGDLNANIGRSYDAVGDSDGQRDRHGHGTKAAGVAAASTDNDAGVAGMCWQCEIWPVKVLADDGGGRHSDVAEGIRWAAEQGADVITLSLGGHGRTNALESAASDAVAAGSVVIASAGNYGTSDPVYPAAYDAVMGVGAVDQDDRRTSYSSYGSWVSVAAPGCTTATISGGGFNRFCGTSSAAPHVAGLAGLAFSADGTASPAAVRAAITDGAASLGQGMGSGRIDADATLRRVEARRGSDDDGGGGGGDTGGGDDSDGGGDDDADDGGNRDGDTGDGDTGDGDTGDGDTGDDSDNEPVLDSVERIVGSDRFATAAALSSQHVAPGGDRVYVATGEHFADALAAGAAAGAESAPVLLAARSQLPASTANELARLQPDEVVVVGGTGVVSDSVVAAAGEAAGAPVSRVAGDNRFATAAEIATTSFSGPLGVAYLATGEGFADALAGVPAAVTEDAPMLLTARDELPDATRDALRELAPRRVVILGGENAVSPRVRQQLLTKTATANVQRLAGDDRFATAAAVADAVFDAGTVEEAALATGQAFPDALAAGPIAGANGSPLLLVARDHLPATTREALRRAGPSRAWLLGGPNAVGESVVSEVRTTTR